MNRQTDRYTGRQTDIQTDRYTDRLADIQTDRQIYRQRNMKMESERQRDIYTRGRNKDTNRERGKSEQ